jgi:hypothetical protein
MKIDQDVLRHATEEGVISPAQEATLRRRLAGAHRRVVAEPWRPLSTAAVLALATICGLAAAAGAHWFGDLGLSLVSAALAVALIAAGRQRFQQSRGVQGQVLLTTGLILLPLVAFGLVRALHHGAALQREGDLIDWMTGPWFAVELVCFLACGLGIALFGLPFLAWPLAVAVWLAAQDAAPLVFGPVPTWGDRVLVSALTGLVTLSAGLAVDRRSRADFAGWLYLPGLLGLCGALLTWREAGDLAVVVTLLLNLGLVATSLLVERRVFAVMGALGAAGAVGHLLDDRLDGAPLVLALAVLGLATLGGAVLYHLSAPRLAMALAGRLPVQVRRWLPPGSPAGPIDR